MRVHSVILRTASTVFNALLGPHYNEGGNLSSGAPKDIPLPEDDAVALEIIFNALHYRVEAIQDLLSYFVWQSRPINTNCALSIVEGNSNDGTVEILKGLIGPLAELGLDYQLVRSTLNPTTDGSGQRIERLASLRNEALKPLLQHMYDDGPKVEWDVEEAIVIFLTMSLCAWTVRLWDVTTGAHRQTLEGHSREVSHVAFSHGKTIASASGDRTVQLWDTTTGAHRQTFEGHSKWVSYVAFSPDGKTIASASEDKTVRLWDATMGAHAKVARREG